MTLSVLLRSMFWPHAHPRAPTRTPARTHLRPSGRIGRIIKLDQDVQSVTKEATALIGKAMVRQVPFGEQTAQVLKV